MKRGSVVQVLLVLWLLLAVTTPEAHALSMLDFNQGGFTAQDESSITWRSGMDWPNSLYTTTNLGNVTGVKLKYTLYANERFGDFFLPNLFLFIHKPSPDTYFLPFFSREDTFYDEIYHGYDHQPSVSGSYFFDLSSHSGETVTIGWMSAIGIGSEVPIVFSDVEFTTVPEPSTVLLLGAGLVGIAVARRRTRKLGY